MGSRLTISSEHQFRYPILEWKVTDGDTTKVLLDLGFNASLLMNCRYVGIDVPEKNTVAGQTVKQVSEAWLRRFRNLQAISLAKDKYAGRFLGHIYAPISETSLTQCLLDRGLGRYYEGGTRKLWSEQELREVELRALVYLEELNATPSLSI